MKVCLILAAFHGVAWSAVADAGEVRAWKDASGMHSIEAEFVEVDGEVAVLKMTSGRKCRVAFNQLSEKDQEFIRQYLSRDNPSAEALPGIELASEAEIRATLTRVLRRPERGKYVTLILAAPLTTTNLKYIAEIDEAIRHRGRVKIACVATNESKLFRLIEPISKANGVFSFGDITQAFDNFSSDCMVFVGFQNSRMSSVAPQDMMPTGEALRQLLFASVRSGRDAYVFEGATLWRPDLQSTEMRELAKCSKSYGKALWIPGLPKNGSFADFVSVLFESERRGKLGLGDLATPFQSE